MHIKTMIEMLEDLAQDNPEAQVFAMHQPTYPLEVGIVGVARRNEIEDIESEDNGPGANGDARGSDIILVLGSFARYGNTAAWEVVRRR